MIFARRIEMTVVSGCLLALAACESPEPAPFDYGVRQVHQADRSIVLDTAEAALVEQGYSIAKRDSAEGVITTESIENDPRDRGSRSGVGLSSSGRTRRFAEVRIAGSTDPLKVYCKVLVQEQATQGYNMYAADRSGSDLPGQQTAIDRDAATTAKQNTVWRTLRRDTAAERRILDAILSRSGGDPAAATAPGAG